MTLCNLNIFVIFPFTLGFVFHLSQGFEVTQSQMDNGLAFISCEHNEKGAKLQDVRLYKTYPGKEMLCQKGQTDCKNVILHEMSFTKYAFVLINLGPEEIEYECEITLEVKGIDIPKRGAPASLLKGKIYNNTCPPPPSPPPLSLFHLNELAWVLTGLLALLFLYSCTITYFYSRQEKTTKQEVDNSTYVTMRKPF